MALFSPNQRARAISREQLLTITDLFRVNKINSQYSKSLIRLTDIALKTTYADLSGQRLSQTNDSDKVLGEASKNGVRVDYSVGANLGNRTKMRAVIGHESAHMLGGEEKGMIGNNEMVTANAIGRYLLGLDRVSDASIRKTNVTNQTQREIEKAFIIGQYDASIKLHKNLRDAEYEAFIGGKSFSYLGRALGVLALSVEEETKIPGIGLFVIRELSRGKRINETIDSVKRGEFNRELIVWLGRHPSVRAHILRIAHPKVFENFKRFVRPKNARKTNPTKPRKKKQVIRLRRV